MQNLALIFAAFVAVAACPRRGLRRVVGPGLLLLIATACGGKQDGGDAGVDAAPDIGSVCAYQETRTSSDRTCNVAADCVVVERQLSCCKAQDEGIRTDAAKQFQSDQAALTASCPACGCDAEPQDELGNLGTSFTATCDNGQCTAHAQ